MSTALDKDAFIDSHFSMPCHAMRIVAETISSRCQLLRPTPVQLTLVHTTYTVYLAYLYLTLFMHVYTHSNEFPINTVHINKMFHNSDPLLMSPFVWLL